MKRERNDDGLTEEVYRAEVLRTYAGPDDRAGKLTLAALGLAGETGEVVDLIKKHLFQGHEIDAQRLCDELGDVLWYLTLLCEAMGYSLHDLMAANVEKLSRRYPNGFDAERSRQRGAAEQEGDVHA